MNENKTNINWYPGHMAKARREIKEKIQLIDVVYEVIDSRMPLSSKISDIDDLLNNKPKILVMTKYDMCDTNETNKIIDYYEKKGNVVVPVDLISGNGVSTIIKETDKIAEKINTDRKKKGMKPRNIRALVIGVPNSGKSTLINKLVGKKATQTGDKPGVTKQVNWIRVGKNIELLDSPGILWPKLDNQEYAHNLAALSSIKEEIVDIEDLSIYILQKLESLYPLLLEKRYGITRLDSEISNTLDIIGEKRGALIKGGEIDYNKVYRLIIRDLKEGIIGKVTFDRITE